MAVAQKIRIIMLKQDIKLKDLAKSLGTSQSNLSDKLTRDNFSEKDIAKIAEALHCNAETIFKLNETGEII